MKELFTLSSEASQSSPHNPPSLPVTWDKTAVKRLGAQAHRHGPPQPLTTPFTAYHLGQDVSEEVGGTGSQTWLFSEVDADILLEQTP